MKIIVMKFHSLILAFILSSSFGIAQIEKSYDYSGFNSIKIESAFYAEIVQSNEYSVKIICQEDMESYLEIELDGNELEIGLKSWKGHRKETPKAIIHLPMLEELEVSGASTAKLIKVEVAELELEVSGASTVEGDLLVKSIEIDASGASSIGLSGMGNKMSLYLSGASSFRGKGFLITDEMLLDCSGASNAHCQVDGDMFITLSGASNFSYHGQGDIVKEEVSGASTISKE